MSTAPTGYKVGSTDLANVFLPLSLGTPVGYNTGFVVSGMGDLSALFAARVATSAPTTGYVVSGVGDLNTIFAPL